MQGVLAGFIRKPGDPRAIRRPGWIAVSHARAPGEIPRVALLRGHGQDFSARFEEGALATGGKRDMKNRLRIHLLIVRPQFREIRRDGHGDLRVLPRGRIVQMKRPKLAVHDAAWARACGLDVEAAFVLHDLPHRARLGVVDKEGDRPLAV